MGDRHVPDSDTPRPPPESVFVPSAPDAESAEPARPPAEPFSQTRWTAFAYGLGAAVESVVALGVILFLEFVVAVMAYLIMLRLGRHGMHRWFFDVGAPGAAVLLPKIVAGAYVLRHVLTIVRHTAQGVDAAPDTRHWAEYGLEYWTGVLTALLAVYLGPGAVVVVLARTGTIPPVLAWGGWVLCAAGVFLLPMAMIACAAEPVARHVFYDLSAGPVVRDPRAYLRLWRVLLLCAVPGTALMASVTVWHVVGRAGLGTRIGTLIPTWLVFIVGWYIAARAMGLFARYHRAHLPFEFPGHGP